MSVKKRILSDMGNYVRQTVRHDAIPIVKALPTVIFRIAILCLTLTLSAEAYGDWRLVLCPMGLLLIMIFINLYAASEINLRPKEAWVNSVNSLILPVYSDVFFLVS